LSSWRKLRKGRDGRPQLVAALASYLRVELEAEAAQVRGSLPPALSDHEAVTAARAAYQEVVQSYSAPSQTRAPLNLGIYLAAYSSAEAQAVLQEVVEEGPKEYADEANAWLGVVLADLGDMDGAMAAYQAAIDSRHTDHAPRSMVNLGELHLARGNLVAARSLLERAISSGHPIHAARARVALAGVLISEGDLDGARTTYEQAIGSEDPGVARAAAENLRFLDAHGDRDTRQRASTVLQQLITVPSWYQTRQILHRHAALLADVETLLRDAEPSGAPEEPDEQQYQQDIRAFLTFVIRVREIGIEPALAERSGIGDDVPIDMRLLFLQTTEASDRFARDGGQSSLADARTACAQLLEHPAWAELAPAVRLDCMTRLGRALTALYDSTGEVEYLDQMARLAESAPAWAQEAGLDPAPFADDYHRLLALRQDVRHLTILREFVDAMTAGTGRAVIDECPELLDERVLERLSSLLERPATEHPDDEEAGRLQLGVDILRLCNLTGIDTALQTVGPAGDHLMDLLGGLDTTVDGLRRHLHNHPELLGEAAGLLLNRIIEAAGQAGGHNGVGEDQLTELREIRELLRRCREIGVDAAIDELVVPRFGPKPQNEPDRAVRAMSELLDAQDSETVRAVLERYHDVLLGDATDATLTSMLREFEQAQDAAKVSFTRDLRDQLRRRRIFGLDETRADNAIAQLIGLPGSPEATLRRLLREYPELLQPVADEFLADLISSGTPGIDTELLDSVEARRRLLRDCRQLGVDAAIATAWKKGELLPKDLRETLQRAFEASLQMLNGELKRPEAATALWHQALQHPALADQPHPVIVTEQYAIFHLLCHRLFHVPGAVDSAVLAFDQAATDTEPDDPQLPQRLQFLADALTDRYEVQGRPDDLRTAVSILDRLGNLPAPAGASRTTDRDNVLAKSLLRWYDRFGTPAELDRAISVLEAATDIASTSEERTTTLLNLSLVLARRFQRDGRLDDLNRAIAIDESLAEQPPSDRTPRSTVLGNHGTNLLTRYEMTHEPGDLRQAIEALTQAVQVAMPGSTDLARHLTTLGNALGEQAATSRRRKDADKAIRVLTAAVEATSQGSLERANRLNNLGAGYLRRYSITGRLRHLDEAIKTLEEGLRATAADAPGYAWRASNLAYALSLRHRRRHNQNDLERAASLFRDSTARNLAVRLESGLHTAQLWGSWAAERLNWPEAAEAYKLGLEATERLFQVQLVRGHKEAWLREVGQLFHSAAYALLEAGDPADAVTALELGRARLLSEAIERERAELDQLAEMGRGSLRDRYLTAASRLRELDTTSFSG
jgi:tetratricopeptide (TPR) repeat protein